MKRKFIAASILLALVPIAIFYHITYGTAEAVTIHVTKTERATFGVADTQHSKYMVYTETETFQNVDSVWWWKFNSSDVQGALKEGRTYRIKVYGYRSPLLSMWRNIVVVEEN